MKMSDTESTTQQITERKHERIKERINSNSKKKRPRGGEGRSSQLRLPIIEEIKREEKKNYYTPQRLLPSHVSLAKSKNKRGQPGRVHEVFVHVQSHAVVLTALDSVAVADAVRTSSS